MQFLPEQGGLFANRLLKGALVGDSGRSRRALEINDSAHRFPWLHRAEAAQNSEGRVDVAVLNEGREEQLVHGDVARLCVQSSKMSAKSTGFEAETGCGK